MKRAVFRGYGDVRCVEASSAKFTKGFQIDRGLLMSYAYHPNGPRALENTPNYTTPTYLNEVKVKQNFLLSAMDIYKWMYNIWLAKKLQKA